MASEVFEGWSNEQLKDYLKENGVNPSIFSTRAKLIDRCVQVGRDVEARVIAQSHRQSSPPTAAQRPLPQTASPQPALTPAFYNPQSPAQAYPHHIATGTPAVPWPVPRPGGGRKRAFICGINYSGTSAQLNGCINDARCMHYLLRHRMGFTDDQMLFMTDDHPNPALRPTRYNIMNGLVWLVSNLQPGDSLVFHYSGHGSQQRDYTGQELDGLNETLCPLDFRYAGEIIDDELNRILVNPLPQGVKLHAIIDACHSGSVMDLPFTATCHAGYLRWESEYGPGVRLQTKGTAGGFCVQFGAARDFQAAADTTRLSGGVPTGAATFSFIQAIERRGLNISYGDLLVEMYNTLQMAGLGGSGGGGGLDGMLLGMLGGGASFRGQEPVMSANYAFDLNHKVNI